MAEYLVKMFRDFLARNGVPATLSTANKLSRLRYCTDDRLVRLLTAMRGIIAYARILLLPIDGFYSRVRINMNPTKSDICSLSTRDSASQKAPCATGFRVPAKTHVEKPPETTLYRYSFQSDHPLENRIIFDILNMSESFISYNKR